MPVDHPRRAIRELADRILDELSDTLDKMDSPIGLARLHRRSCGAHGGLQVLDSVRSERLLMEELNDNLRFGWLVGLNRDDAVWHPTV